MGRKQEVRDLSVLLAHHKDALRGLHDEHQQLLDLVVSVRYTLTLAEKDYNWGGVQAAIEELGGLLERWRPEDAWTRHTRMMREEIDR